MSDNTLILAVDDNPVNLKLIRVLLTQAGYQVYTTTNAEETLVALETIHPQLILMDIQMPGMDGLTLTRRLKSQPETCNINVLALTAYAMKGDDQKARDAGCNGYISKPIDVDTFVESIKKYL